MKKKIIILGCMDTKGQEYAFIKDIIEKAGCDTLLIDVGVIDPPMFKPDISRQEVAKAAGKDFDQLIKDGPTRDKIAPIMTEGAKKLVVDLVKDKKADGIISLGGTQGTSLATNAMRELPVGFPKVMVSTMASGDTFKFVGLRDITMMNSVADIMGLNRVTRKILANAAGAICGMVGVDKDSVITDKQLIAITTVGVTTPGAMAAKKVLEDAGYETVVFHAVGTGGQAMEQLVKEGDIKGLLDIATVEVINQMLGGFLAATPERMTVATKMGIPQVICPGAIGDVVFGPPEEIPEKFKGRAYAIHSSLFSCVRTTAEEVRALAVEQAKRVNPAKGPVEWFIPMKGFCSHSVEGAPIHDPESDMAYVDELKKQLRDDIPIHTRDTDINDPAFAAEIAKHLIELMKKKYG